MVVTFPAKPLDDLAGGNQSKITIVHTRLDPVERTAISFASQLAVDKINAGVLAAVIGAGQQEATPLNDVLGAADAATQKLRDAVNSGNADAINAALADLDVASSSITANASELSALFAQVAAQGSDSRAQQLADQAQQLAQRLDDAHQRGGQIDAAAVDELAQTVSTIRTDVQQLSGVDPSVLSQPFIADVQLAVPGTHRITDWYAPAAIVLILQQFGLAFGAMSYVRERQLGITDVLRVAPIEAMPALIGKYLAYLLLGGAMAARAHRADGSRARRADLRQPGERCRGDGTDPVRLDRAGLRALAAVPHRRPGHPVRPARAARQPVLQRLLPVARPARRHRPR